ncbi:cobyrinate a,c-diamide synthase [Beijerinckia indica]
MSSNARGNGTALSNPHSARGLIIAAPRSSSGKTMLTLGLMRAWRKMGVAIAGTKNGPDYIDPAFHEVATGRQSYNLDTYAMPPSLILALAEEASQDEAIILCEGSMGLFDGVVAPEGRSGASADLAALFGWPVVLVLDVKGQAQTAAAIVKGCATYDPRVRIGGVILNNVSSERHRVLITEAIAQLGLPVLGSLPRDAAMDWPERHLGLVQARETPDLESKLEALADFVAANVDLAGLLDLAREQPLAIPSHIQTLAPPAQNIAIARDEAFSFLYPHLLLGWRRAGAEFTFFSPLADEPVPHHCDFCWLPGGYPELHAGRLAAAERFLASLGSFAQRGIHGECGGYMLLGESLTDAAGKAHRMAGLLGHSCSFEKRRLHLGYREARLAADGALGAAGSLLRGHEFHYATVSETHDEPFAEVHDAQGKLAHPGSRRGRVSGSFFHVIAPASLMLAP